MAKYAHPSDMSGWITNYKTIWQHFFSDHRPCSYKSILADVISTYYGSIGSNASSLSNNSFQVGIFSIYCASWVNYVRKNARRPNEHIVSTNYSSINRDIVLNFNIIS